MARCTVYAVAVGEEAEEQDGIRRVSHRYGVRYAMPSWDSHPEYVLYFVVLCNGQPGIPGGPQTPHGEDGYPQDAADTA